MTRSQRFPFPLPSRKSSSRPSTNQPPPIPPTDHRSNGFVEADMSKAQKVLGATDKSSAKAEYKKWKKQQKSITSKPSFVSITISEATSNKREHKGSVATETKSTRGSKPKPRDLHERPSSPLLGNKFRNTTNISDASSDIRARPLRQFDSASSLHSFYDPTKSPLAISQQTSESAARDYALRKRYPPITGLNSHPIEDDDESDVYAEIPQKVHMFEKRRNEAEPKPLNRRPPRIDFSKLFPRHQPSSGALLSPQRLTHSPSPLSEASVPLRPQLKSKMSSNSTASNLTESSVPSVDPRTRNKILPFDIVPQRASVRQPHQAYRNWFDRFEEVHSDDDLPEDTRSLAISKPMLAQLEHRHSRNPSEDTIRAPSVCNETKFPFTPTLNSAGGQKSPTPETGHVETSLLVWEKGLAWTKGKSNPSLISRPSATSRKTSGSTMSNADLRKESVLCLSSSDDEEEPLMEVDMSSKSPRKINRSSVATSAYDSDNVEFGTAELISSGRSKHSSKKSPARVKISPKFPKEVPKRSSSAGVAMLNVPQPRNVQSSSSPSSSFFEDIEANITNSPSPSPVRDTHYLSRLPQTTYNPSAEYTVAATPHQPRQSRVMAVTKEEESLLEAMRQKRATMRQSLFEQGSMSAKHRDVQSGLEIIEVRPRTSHNESQSSFLRMSTDSKASVVNRPRTSFEHRASLQAGDLIFPDPPLPATAHLHHYRTSQSIHSARDSLNLSQSDRLPSPPSTSRASPITPTTAHSSAADRDRERIPRYSISKELNPGRGCASPTNDALDRRHSRTRTRSSGIIVLDGVEEHARGVARGVAGRQVVTVSVEDLAWPVWAVDGWVEAGVVPGVAVA